MDRSQQHPEQLIRREDIQILGRPYEAAQDLSQDEEIEDRPFSDYVLPIGLFITTIFTTLWAGAYQTYTGTTLGPVDFLFNSPESLWRGIPFAATLLTILVTHEFGHYLLSRLHRVPASLPLFIPGPPHVIGTFGAIIRLRGPIMNRRALFDIGVAGPLAGFVVAVVALAVGLSLSQIGDSRYGYHYGEPLLLQFMSWFVFGPLPEKAEVIIHPIGFAAWFGLFVTSLNLIPIGQLDGSHVAYALWGPRQRILALLIVPVLIVLGYLYWPGWFLWAFLAGLWGLGHPPVRDPEPTLGTGRILMGWVAFIVFVLTFTPNPFSLH